VLRPEHRIRAALRLEQRRGAAGGGVVAPQEAHPLRGYPARAIGIDPTTLGSAKRCSDRRGRRAPARCGSCPANRAQVTAACLRC